MATVIEDRPNGERVVQLDPGEEGYNFTHAAFVTPDSGIGRLGWIDLGGEFDGKRCVLTITLADAQTLAKQIVKFLAPGDGVSH